MSLASFPAPHLRNDCWPCPNTFLVFGSCCQPPSPLAHDCLIFLHLLLAGFPSMKIPIPILTHQDPQPLWKTKLIPFHLPSPTVDSPLLLTQIWVWHPKLVRHFHPPFVLFFVFFRICFCFLTRFPSKSFLLFLAVKLKDNVNTSYFQSLPIKYETLG